MTDEIIRELWRIKDEIGKEHGYDLDALGAHLRNVNRKSERTEVERGPVRRGFSVGEEPGSYDPEGQSDIDKNQQDDRKVE